MTDELLPGEAEQLEAIRQEARFTEGLEEFVGPSDPDSFTLFVIPTPESKYKDQLLKTLEVLREGIESDTITELAYVALQKDEWKSGFTGSASRLRMAGAIMDLAIERLGYVKG